MFSFGNYIWKTLKIKMLHPLTLPQHQPMPQLQTLTQHQLLQDPPQIIKVNNLKSFYQGKETLMIEKSHKFGITLQNLIMILKPLELNCGKNYACHTIINGTSNMWSHLKVCKKFHFVVDKKQKNLVLEPKKKNGELGD